MSITMLLQTEYFSECFALWHHDGTTWSKEQQHPPDDVHAWLYSCVHKDRGNSRTVCMHACHQ